MPDQVKSWQIEFHGGMSCEGKIFLWKQCLELTNTDPRRAFLLVVHHQPLETGKFSFGSRQKQKYRGYSVLVETPCALYKCKAEVRSIRATRLADSFLLTQVSRVLRCCEV